MPPPPRHMPQHPNPMPPQMHQPMMPQPRHMSMPGAYGNGGMHHSPRHAVPNEHHAPPHAVPNGPPPPGAYTVERPMPMFGGYAPGTPGGALKRGREEAPHSGPPAQPPAMRSTPAAPAHAAAPPSSTTGYGPPPGGPPPPGPGGGDVRPGDWTCPGCGSNVFASKSECFKCGAPKPPMQDACSAASAAHAGGTTGAGRSHCNTPSWMMAAPAATAAPAHRPAELPRPPSGPAWEPDKATPAGGGGDASAEVRLLRLRLITSEGSPRTVPHPSLALLNSRPPARVGRRRPRCRPTGSSCQSTTTRARACVLGSGRGWR